MENKKEQLDNEDDISKRDGYATDPTDTSWRPFYTEEERERFRETRERVYGSKNHRTLSKTQGISVELSPNESKQIKDKVELQMQGQISDEWLRSYATYKWGMQMFQILDGKEFDSLETPVMLRGIHDVTYLIDELVGEFYGLGSVNGVHFNVGNSVNKAFDYANIDNGGWVYAAKLLPDASVFQLSNVKDTQDIDFVRPFDKDYGRHLASQGYDAVYLVDDECVVVLNLMAVGIDMRTLPDQLFMEEMQNSIEISDISPELIRDMRLRIERLNVEDFVDVDNILRTRQEIYEILRYTTKTDRWRNILNSYYSAV